MKHLTEYSDPSRFPGVPTDPVRTGFVSTGFLRERALYCSGTRIEYRASHSSLYFCGFLFILAAIVWHLPFDIQTATPLNLMQCIALMLCWGGICSLLPFFYILNRGQRTVIDLNTRTLSTIQRNRVTREFNLADLRCLQLCWSKCARHHAYELNLCFPDAVRINLITVAYARPARKLASKLSSLLHKEIHDCTELNQSMRS